MPLPDGDAYYRSWLSKHARCETCAHARRSLFGLECGQTGREIAALDTCDDWQQFPDFAPAHDHVLFESIRMDAEFFAGVIA